MKTTKKDIGERQVSLTIEVTEERARTARRRVARHISREVDIPGFRKGKAPYDVVVQRLGQEVVFQELLNLLAEDVYREALEQEDVTPYSPGMLEDVSREPLTLTFTVPLVPEVDLGDYRAYRREPPEPDVSEEEVNRALQKIREQNAILAPLERPAGEGDLLVAELIGRGEDGTEFVHEDEARILLDPEAETGIPGLIDALIGLQQGEQRTFTLALPPNFQVKELQGQQAEFSVDVENVYERILPELDDDLARTVGNYDSFEELENNVRERIRARERAELQGEYAEQVLQGIIDEAHVSYPPVMLEEALDDAFKDEKRRIERREHMMLEDYLRIQGMTEDDLRDELKDEVEHSLKRSLVLGEIVEQEELEISEEELDVVIAETSERYGEGADKVRAALSQPEEQRNIRNRMLANKAVQRIVEIAKGEGPELAGTESDEAASEKSEASEEIEA